MRDGVISVIVPAYNASFCVEKCLDSICSQTYRELEIIVVNDGSNDDTESLVSKYAKIDNRIILLTKENGGVSSARNLGIKTSSGEFITFVDADDYIESDFCQKLIDVQKENNSDIVISGLIFVKPFAMDKKSFENRTIFRDKFVSTFNEYANTIVYQSVVGKLYKSNVINGHKFTDNVRIGEDTRFNYNVFLNVDIIATTDYCGYNYVYNTFSATHKFSLEDINCLQDLRNCGVEYYIDGLGGKEIPSVLNQVFVGNILGEIVSLSSNAGFKEIVDNLEIVTNIPEFKANLKSYKPHNKKFLVLKIAIQTKCWLVIILLGLINKFRYYFGGK